MNKGDTSSSRIRENQRRSRARRKEYVRQLEEKLRSYERLGVAATKEVQEAGRKVATENILLRSLLMLRGTTEEEIREHLKSHRATTCAAPPLSSQTIPAATASLQPLPILHVPLNRRHSPANDSFPEPNQDRHKYESFTGEYGLRNTPTGRRTEHNRNRIEAASAAVLRSTIPKPVSETPQFDGQSTSCETAARIITSMRDNSDIRDIRSELGCKSEENCMVRNMSIFDQLDRE